MLPPRQWAVRLAIHKSDGERMEMTETKEERDPRCVAVKCLLDGRNCDLSKCSLINREATEKPLPKKDAILRDECGG